MMRASSQGALLSTRVLSAAGAAVATSAALRVAGSHLAVARRSFSDSSSNNNQGGTLNNGGTHTTSSSSIPDNKGASSSTTARSGDWWENAQQAWREQQPFFEKMIKDAQKNHEEMMVKNGWEKVDPQNPSAGWKRPDGTTTGAWTPFSSSTQSTSTCNNNATGSCSTGGCGPFWGRSCWGHPGGYSYYRGNSGWPFHTYSAHHVGGHPATYYYSGWRPFGFTFFLLRVLYLYMVFYCFMWLMSRIFGFPWGHHHHGYYYSHYQYPHYYDREGNVIGTTNTNSYCTPWGGCSSSVDQTSYVHPRWGWGSSYPSDDQQSWKKVDSLEWGNSDATHKKLEDNNKNDGRGSLSPA